jgi:predicted ATPase/tRNA A-37 threonylcarbamoyl transferase component Bud32
VLGVEAESRVPMQMGRYEIRRVLGHGAMGVVYEAYDTKDDAVVALKTISPNRPQVAEQLYRLKQEFRAVADLQHPNLIRFGELSSHEGQWFFTMELVRGRGFVDYVRDEGRTFDEPRLRGALAQLISALAAIHDAGLVHRDVKPSNVLVTDEGRVVVLDFGLIVAHSELANAPPEAMSGTPGYMAPEQIEGTHVGPAADWYAVGAMLFTALTGRRPFTGGAIDVMTATLTQEAPSPRALAPSVPEDLDALTVDLLRISPDARPTVDAIRARLGLPAADSATVGAAESSHTFVGRDRELHALGEAFREVTLGQGRTVIVEGEPGIGKSALVQRFLSSLGKETLVLFGRCYEQESMPFKGLDAIVDALSQHLLQLSHDEVRAILAGGVRFLATVFPVLHRVPLVAESTSHARSVDNPMALREQAFGEFERLLGALARRQRVVLFLDDLQWADRDSLALIHRALHQVSRPPCLFLTTMRSGAELPASAAELFADASRITLGGLSESEASVLCAELWRAGGEARSGEMAESHALMDQAAGHPLFLAELVRSARRGDAASVKPTKLEDVLWERIQERDPLERRFLEMLAIAGAPIAYDVVAKAAALDVGECQTRLGALRAAQLIRVSRRGEERLVVPYHDRVRESLLQHREDAGRSLAHDHLWLGRALFDATPPEALSGRVFAIVQHLNAGRELVERRAERVRLAELNLVAAREAQLATAYAAACTFASVGLSLLEEAGWEDAYATTRDLQIEQMCAELLSGDVARARECFDAARTRIFSPVDRTDLYVRWIELESNRGDFEAAIAAGRERLREVGVSCPARATPLSVLLQYIAVRWVQGARTPDDLRNLRASKEPLRESAMKILMAMTPAAYWISTDLAGFISLKLARMSIRHGVTDVSSYGFATYGVILEGAFGKCAEAAAMGKVGLGLNERFQNESLTPKLYLVNGQFLAPWVQPFAEAKMLLETSYESAAKQGETAYEAFAACSLSHLSTLHAADLAASKATSEWARDVCARRKDWNMVGSILSHLRFTTTLRGEIPVEVPRARTADPAFRALVGDPAKTPSAYDGYWEFNGWIAYYFGHIDVAWECVLETRRFVQAHFGHLTTLDLCFLECLVAAKMHDGASWLKRLRWRWILARGVRKLRAWAAGCPANFEPHYLIARAELARVHGRTAQADAYFDAAIASARERGAGLREGLALELASLFADRRGDTHKGARLREEAREAYRRCGATAKANTLGA